MCLRWDPGNLNLFTFLLSWIGPTITAKFTSSCLEQGQGFIVSAERTPLPPSKKKPVEYHSLGESWRHPFPPSPPYHMYVPSPWLASVFGFQVVSKRGVGGCDPRNQEPLELNKTYSLVCIIMLRAQNSPMHWLISWCRGNRWKHGPVSWLQLSYHLWVPGFLHEHFRCKTSTTCFGCLMGRMQQEHHSQKSQSIGIPNTTNSSASYVHMIRKLDILRRKRVSCKAVKANFATSQLFTWEHRLMTVR